MNRRPAYSFTGSYATVYNAAVAPTHEFYVTPTAVFGVAYSGRHIIGGNINLCMERNTDG
jgi:hypothetical protein